MAGRAPKAPMGRPRSGRSREDGGSSIYVRVSHTERKLINAMLAKGETAASVARELLLREADWRKP